MLRTMAGMECEATSVYIVLDLGWTRAVQDSLPPVDSIQGGSHLQLGPHSQQQLDPAQTVLLQLGRCEAQHSLNCATYFSLLDRGPIGQSGS